MSGYTYMDRLIDAYRLVYIRADNEQLENFLMSIDVEYCEEAGIDPISVVRYGIGMRV